MRFVLFFGLLNSCHGEETLLPDQSSLSVFNSVRDVIEMRDVIEQ